MARILLAEDDPEVRSVLREALAEPGHHVHGVAGRDALAELSAARWDMVIASVPTSVEAVVLCRCAQAAGARCLLLSGHPDTMRALDEQRLSYLAKPMTGEALRDRVATLLNPPSP